MRVLYLQVFTTESTNRVFLITYAFSIYIDIDLIVLLLGSKYPAGQTKHSVVVLIIAMAH